MNLFTPPSPKSQRLLTPLKHQHTNFIMPKEKTTTRGSKKAAGKADGGKKKKGTSQLTSCDCARARFQY